MNRLALNKLKNNKKNFKNLSQIKKCKILMLEKRKGLYNE